MNNWLYELIYHKLWLPLHLLGPPDPFNKTLHKPRVVTLYYTYPLRTYPPPPPLPPPPIFSIELPEKPFKTTGGGGGLQGVCNFFWLGV